MLKLSIFSGYLVKFNIIFSDLCVFMASIVLDKNYVLGLHVQVSELSFPKIMRLKVEVGFEEPGDPVTKRVGRSDLDDLQLWPTINASLVLELDEQIKSVLLQIDLPF